jgi:UDPglucose--hexose-1-phosphate uridylyltransferase
VPLCTTARIETDEGHRVVHADERVLVLCPYWSAAPYEMLVIPRAHEAHMAAAHPADLVAVGRAVRDALAALGDLIGDVPYNVVLHTAPHHGEGLFHWHLHVVPRLTSLAGFEAGTGVLINIVAPEAAAAELRTTGLGDTTGTGA